MMIPITRKEQYINEIVGKGKTAPETPQTREEFFFAEILGEVIAPSPVTRVEKYLSAIAGQYGGDLPTPITRIEYFLAKAAGMDVTIPTPITREEMLWANYALIVEKELSGLPPLTFKAKKAGTLSNYRIYGNTVSGESVGDRTGNLFDINSPNIKKHRYYDTNGIEQQNWNHDCSEYIHCKSGVTYTLSFYSKNQYYGVFINLWNSQKQFVSNLVDSGTITVQDITLSYVFTPNQDGYITFNFLYDSGYMEDIMLVEGSAPLPYEPYGYRVAVTVGGVNIFDENYEGLNTRTYYRPLYVGDGTFTLSTNAPKNSLDMTNLYLIAGAVSTGASYVNNGVSLNSPRTVTSVDGYVTVAYRISGGIDPSEYHAMLNKGSSALPYEPYSEPVTTNIYLPEQISKVGNVTEYIDYREQKQYFADGTSADVTLPALPTFPGTNTLSVGTTVQPSDVYIKYEGAR